MLRAFSLLEVNDYTFVDMYHNHSGRRIAPVGVKSESRCTLTDTVDGLRYAV
jgi:hypothetical protein